MEKIISLIIRIAKRRNETNKEKFDRNSTKVFIFTFIIGVITFLYALIASRGSTNEGEAGGAVWWLMVIYIWIAVPITIGTRRSFNKTNS